MTRRVPLLTAGLVAVTLAAPPAEAAIEMAARATVRPGVAQLGERVTYRGRVVAPAGVDVRWMPPESRPDLSWGAARVGRKPGTAGPDTTWIEIPLQVFETGTVAIPGVRFVLRGGSPEPRRLPVARVQIAPVIAANDSTARLKELRTLGAPWWERVPWVPIVIGLVLIAAAIVAWRRLRRRAPTPVPVAAPAVARRDPTAEALAALADLRAEGLPALGRFDEHAFRLGQILRRFLEATMGTTRPGDTTPELLAHLRDAGLDVEPLQRLAGLLRTWDRIKFARDPFTTAEALRTEDAVEAFVRRPSRTDSERVA